MEKQQIEQQVSSLLDTYGYDPRVDTYFDVVDFVKRNGFTVGTADMADTEDGFIAIRPGEKSQPLKVIGVNKTRSLEWMRFIIAHEFGHYVFDYKGEDIFLHREHKTGKDEKENDADYFAAALLMPKESFKRVYQDLKAKDLLDNTIQLNLSAAFKATIKMVQRRIEEVTGDVSTDAPLV